MLRLGRSSFNWFPQVMALYSSPFKSYIWQHQRQFFQFSTSVCWTALARGGTFGSRSILKISRGVRISQKHRASPWSSQSSQRSCGLPLSAPGRMKVASYRPCLPARSCKWRRERWWGKVVRWDMNSGHFGNETRWNLEVVAARYGSETLCLGRLRICNNIHSPRMESLTLTSSDWRGDMMVKVIAWQWNISHFRSFFCQIRSQYCFYSTRTPLYILPS